MHDLKTNAWQGLARHPVVTELTYLVDDGAIRRDEIRAVAEVFVNNAYGFLQLSELIPAVFLGGNLYQRAETEALVELTGSPLQKEAGELPPDVIERRNKLAFEYSSRELGILFRGLAHPDKRSPPTSAYQDCLRQGLDDKVHFLMSMQVVAMWTAFETLAGDLWEAALNAHPKTLYELKGDDAAKEKKNQDTEDVEDDEGDIEEASITLSASILQKEKFNLAKVMGTLLRRQFNFARLPNIRTAYELAFWLHGDSVVKAIRDDSITGLCALRNLIVHHRGVCGTKYRTTSHKLKDPGSPCRLWLHFVHRPCRVGRMT